MKKGYLQNPAPTAPRPQPPNERSCAELLYDLQKEILSIKQDTSTGFGVGYMKATFDICDIVSDFIKQEGS